jgi:formate hydrogenlyase transcriptional activator
MEEAVQSLAEILARDGREVGDSGLFSIEGVLKLQKLIFAGSPLSEVLTYIARLVEAQAEGMSCTIWLPDEDGKELYCAAAPSLPGFSAQVGTIGCWPERRILRHGGLSEGFGVRNRHPDQPNLGELSRP